MSTGFQTIKDGCFGVRLLYIYNMYAMAMASVAAPFRKD